MTGRGPGPCPAGSRGSPCPISFAQFIFSQAHGQTPSDHVVPLLSVQVSVFTKQGDDIRRNLGLNWSINYFKTASLSYSLIHISMHRQEYKKEATRVTQAVESRRVPAGVSVTGKKDKRSNVLWTISQQEDARGGGTKLSCDS